MKSIRFDVVSSLFDDKGDETSVALSRDNLVIEVHQSQIHSHDLYYTLGKLDVGVPVALKSAFVGNGTRPCVAASTSGGSLAVVEVHERSTAASLGYRVGVIDGNRIDWPSGDTEYDKGGYRPSIALDGLRAVGVHQVNEQGISNLYYKVGTVDPRTRSISDFVRATRFVDGVNPRVATANGHAVVVYHAADDILQFVVGRLEGGSIVWGVPGRFATSGLTAAVAMREDGLVLLLWGDISIDNPRKFSRTAMLDAAGLTLRLSDDEYVVNTVSELEPATSPLFVNRFAVAMNDTIAIETVSTGSSYLGSSSSLVLNRAGWMGENLDALCERNLHEITIPGSHDASTYVIVDCSGTGHDCNSRTQRNNYYEQLRSGIRYFDVRPLYFRGELTTGHIDDSFRGCNSAPLGEILDDVARFMATGARELVILKFSHFRDRDTETLGFTRSQKAALVRIVRDKLEEYLYTGPAGNLGFTPIGTLLAGNGIVLPVFDEFTGDKDLLGAGLYTYADETNPDRDRDANLTVYDSYADSNSVDNVYADQLAKLRSHSDAQLFLFSATLTQTTRQALGCQVKLLDATVTLAASGNANLARKFNEYYGKRTFTRHTGPSIIYVDLASDFATDVAIFLNRHRYLGDKLYAERRDYLIPGDSVSSFTDLVALIYQADGDLVLRSLTAGGGVIATSKTKGKPAWRCIMQEDGNFVIYSQPGVSVYQTHTGGNPGALLKVQDDKKAAIYSKDGVYLKDLFEGT